MTLTPDKVLAELRRIREEQTDLDPDSNRYVALEQRRRELVETARNALDTAKGRDALTAELTHLEERLQAIDDEKIEIPSWQLTMTRNGRFAINDPRAHASQINATLEENALVERSEIEARIRQLRALLAE